MAQYIKELYWDIDKDLQQNITAQQGDIQSRYLRFHLLQNSLALDLSNCTVKIYALKADGTQVFNNITVEDATKGQILVELTSQTLALSGDLPCQLKIYGSDNSLLNTRQFSITVKPSLSDTGVESTNEFTGLQIALADTQKWNDEFASIYPNIETKYQTNLNNLSSELAEKANQSDLNTTNQNVSNNIAEINLKADKTYVDNKFGTLGSTFNFKGSDTTANINSKTGANVGDYWHSTDGNTNLAWNGTSWVDIGNNLNIGDASISTSKIQDRAIGHWKQNFPWAKLLSTSPININYKDNKIYFPSNSFWIIADNENYGFSGHDAIDISTLNYNQSICILYYDLTTSSIKIGYLNDTISDNILLLSAFYGSYLITESNVKIIGTDGGTLNNGFFTNYVPIISDGAIDFEFQYQEIVYNNVYIISGNNYYPAGSYTIPITNTNDGISGLFYDKIQQKLIAVHYQDFGTINSNDRYALVATFWYTKGVVFAPFTYAINNKIPYKAYTDSKIQVYDENNNRLILPDDMYFIDTKSLPLYKDSIVPSSEGEESFKSALINIDSNNNIDIEYFENINLNPNNLQNAFEIDIKQKVNNSYMYRKLINKHVVTSTVNSGKSKTILGIGDSLTNRNLLQYLKQNLATYGVTATMLGTMLNGTVQGEGREGWTYTNFVGSDNIWNNDGSVITPGNNSDLNHNPFLKLATDADKQNHPDWCFRNTGSRNEKSYSSDTDKTGNFYIFDFANYLSSCSIANPDIVTIALSTNDIWQQSVNSVNPIQTCSTSLEIMIKQIKAALPNVIIGIIPAPVTASTDDGNTFFNTACSWIEQCITNVKSYQSIYNNLYIVPVWCHMNRDFIHPYSSDIALSSVNDSLKSSRSEFVHFGETGKNQYVAVTTSWVMNVI